MVLTDPIMTENHEISAPDWKGHRNRHRGQSSEKLPQVRSLLRADRGDSSQYLQFGGGYWRHGSCDALGPAGKGRRVHCDFWSRVAGRSVVGSILNIC